MTVALVLLFEQNGMGVFESILEGLLYVGVCVTDVCLLRSQLRELQSMGFRDVSKCEEALRQSGGEVKGALSLLQRPLLESFHQRIWTNQTEPPINLNDPDKQVGPQCLLGLHFTTAPSLCALG